MYVKNYPYIIYISFISCILYISFILYILYIIYTILYVYYTYIYIKYKNIYYISYIYILIFVLLLLLLLSLLLDIILLLVRAGIHLSSEWFGVTGLLYHPCRMMSCGCQLNQGASYPSSPSLLWLALRIPRVIKKLLCKVSVERSEMRILACCEAKHP